MKKALSLVAFTGLLVALALPSETVANPSCKRTTFETTEVKEACQAGGQGAAKKAMKEFTKKYKSAKIKECASCHSKMSGDYPLKPDGLTLYKDALAGAK